MSELILSHINEPRASRIGVNAQPVVNARPAAKPAVNCDCDAATHRDLLALARRTAANEARLDDSDNILAPRSRVMVNNDEANNLLDAEQARQQGFQRPSAMTHNAADDSDNVFSTNMDPFARVDDSLHDYPAHDSPMWDSNPYRGKISKISSSGAEVTTAEGKVVSLTPEASSGKVASFWHLLQNGDQVSFDMTIDVRSGKLQVCELRPVV